MCYFIAKENRLGDDKSLIAEILKKHVYKKNDTFSSETLKGKFTLYQYVYQLYILNHAVGDGVHLIKMKDENGQEKIRNVFKEYNRLLHKIFPTDNIIVAIPNITDIPEVHFLEVDAKDDGHAYFIDELSDDAPFSEDEKTGKYYVNFVRGGKYEDNSN